MDHPYRITSEEKFENRGDDTSVCGLALIYLRFVQRTETKGIAEPLSLL